MSLEDAETNAGDIDVQEVEDQSEVNASTPPFGDGDEVAEEKEEAPWVLSFGGYNEVGEPVSDFGDVLVLGQDYVKKEYEEARPMRTSERRVPQWVSPLSIL
uniref:Uncharacterized protein n=1 Tax=Cannabis sativa TaxID=3483 RepID=A0A803QPX6_CANSA